jgi:tRNA (mo5U34)-methyltransferase
MTESEKRELASKVPVWFHSHDFGDGVVVAGHKSLNRLRQEWAQLALPDLAGKSVLDINTWDGWFALEAERHGAKEVVALDWYVWCMDLVEHQQYWSKYAADGAKPFHALPYFRPQDLPGKIGFDTARKIRASRVQEIVGDFATMELEPLRNRFDVVLYLGTLYHMVDPIGSLRRLYEVTAPGGFAIVETQAMSIVGHEDTPLCESYGPLHMLERDPSNWWSPNAMALRQMLLAVGFETAEIIVGPPSLGSVTISKRDAIRALMHWRIRRYIAPSPWKSSIHSYRAVARARRSTESSTRTFAVPKPGATSEA